MMSKISGQKKIAGVEMLQDGKGYFYHVVILQKHKEEISLEGEWPAIRTEEELGGLLGGEIPAYLIFNIRGILHKQADANGGADQQLQSVFPNIDLSSFYWQSVGMENGQYMMSIVRKEALDGILALISSKNIWVVGINLGSYHVRHIAPFLVQKGTVEVSGYRLEFNGQFELKKAGKWAGPKTGVKVQVGDDEIRQELLPAYAAAFKGLVIETDVLDVPMVVEKQNEFFHKQVFQKASVAILASILLLLLANTFFYYHFKSRNSDAKAVLSQKQYELSVLDSLRGQVHQQGILQMQTNIHRSSLSSFYADRIGASVPKGIRLKKMEVFPMQGKESDYREGELWQYQKDRVVIKGQCRNSLIYNEWIRALQLLDWVESVQHLTYKETNLRLKEFEMSLLINGL